MRSRLRTVAVLMLLAGASLGILAARALQAVEPGPGKRVSPAIEESVRMFQRDYQLSDEAADLVRQQLLDLDRRMRDKLWELRERHADEFVPLTAATDENIRKILEGDR